ncbi:MAG: hypothetical protein A2X22_04745 [Bacteroidetes bacterium GWF2_49_14]|nr:MAG: hypothetical protein A2X22_04745 [Bacteroidetes bacterium GWF2_49_14]HBB93189.1 hypothetical protein [Bacteroidales bacterium]
MKSFQSLLFLAFLSFAACSCNRSSTSGILIINIDEALKSRGTFKLSQIADDVEFIQLHGMDNQTYIKPGSYNYVVGLEAILVLNYDPLEVLLFSRNGSFIRKISQQGKGPGEFTGSLVAGLNNANRTLLICDNSGKKFLLFDFEGNCLIERQYQDVVNVNLFWIGGVRIDENENFVLCNGSPPSQGKKTYDLLIFDKNLSFLTGINEKPPKGGSPQMFTGSLPRIIELNGEIHYWSKGQDTIFRITDNYKPEPVQLILNLAPAVWDDLHSRIISGNTSLSNILETKQCIIIEGSREETPFIVVFDKGTGKGQQVQTNSMCGIPMFEKTIGIENDLFGFGPIFLSDYITLQNKKMVLILHPGMVEWIEENIKGRFTDCLQASTVLLPDKRDELIRIIKNLDENSGPVLMVVKLK